MELALLAEDEISHLPVVHNPEPRPDAELLALFERWQSAVVAREAADKAASAALKRFRRPKDPKAMLLREDDKYLLPLPPTLYRGTDREMLTFNCEDYLEGKLRVADKLNNEHGDRLRARANEILPAVRKWKDENARRAEKSGFTAAEKRLSAACDEVGKLFEQIEGIRPLTLAGLRAKATVILEFEGFEDGCEYDSGDPTASAAMQLVHDFIKLTSTNH